jgi:2-keto-3-deoxy-galactonokinase
MLTLSKAVEKTKEEAKGENYATAAFKVLRSMGFSKPKVTTVRVAQIVNDIGADESVSVLSAVMSFLGKEGAEARKANAGPKDQQFTLARNT